MTTKPTPPSGNQRTEEAVLVMDAEAIRKAIRRIAHEIIEQNHDLKRLVIAGIPTRGKVVAARIVSYIAEIEGIAPTIGTVDVSMHRDDLATRARISVLEATDLPLDLDGRPLVLIDDVLYTGRSCRAAMDAVASFGRPSRIQLAALVDRGNCQSGRTLSEKMFPRRRKTESVSDLRNLMEWSIPSPSFTRSHEKNLELQGSLRPCRSLRRGVEGYS